MSLTHIHGAFVMHGYQPRLEIRTDGNAIYLSHSAETVSLTLTAEQLDALAQAIAEVRAFGPTEPEDDDLP